MSCALTQGYNLDCRDSVGGVKEVYISELGNITAAPVTSGTITSITMVTGSQFRKYQLQPQTASFEDAIQTNSANGTIFYEPSFTMTIRKLQASLRNEIRLLAQNKLALIVLDRNGKYWALGFTNGMELQNSKVMSGKAMGDFNGYELAFKGAEELPACEVSGSLISALLQPAS